MSERPLGLTGTELSAPRKQGWLQQGYGWGIPLAGTRTRTLTSQCPHRQPHTRPGCCHSAVTCSRELSWVSLEGNACVTCRGTVAPGSCREVWKISHYMFSPSNPYDPPKSFFQHFPLQSLHYKQFNWTAGTGWCFVSAQFEPRQSTFVYWTHSTFSQ